MRTAQLRIRKHFIRRRGKPIPQSWIKTCPPLYLTRLRIFTYRNDCVLKLITPRFFRHPPRPTPAANFPAFPRACTVRYCYFYLSSAFPVSSAPRSSSQSCKSTVLSEIMTRGFRRIEGISRVSFYSRGKEIKNLIYPTFLRL